MNNSALAALAANKPNYNIGSPGMAGTSQQQWAKDYRAERTSAAIAGINARAARGELSAEGRLRSLYDLGASMGNMDTGLGGTGRGLANNASNTLYALKQQQAEDQAKREAEEDRAWEMEQREFSREGLKKAREMMEKGPGGGSVGGSFRVTGLR